MIHNDFSNGADRQGTIQRCRRPLAGNISEHKSEAALSVGQKIVKVAAQFACGHIPGSEIETRHFPCTGRQQLEMDFPCRIEIVPKPPFTLAGFFIEPCILQCDGHIGAESG